MLFPKGVRAGEELKAASARHRIHATTAGLAAHPILIVTPIETLAPIEAEDV
jgi:hypothetical protein